MRANRLERLDFLAVALVAFLAHAGGLRNGFTNWDDPGYVLANPLLTEHSLAAAGRLFTRFYYNDYYPLTQLSYLIDHALWGLTPAGYHLTNVLLHAASSALALGVALVLLGARWPARVAALAFALHPVNVESVAWVAERKNVLSMFFFLASFRLYLARDDHPARGRALVAASLAAFVAAALAKSIVTPLPLVLIAYDALVARKALARLPEKLPFFAVSAAAAVVTVWSQGEAGAIPPFIGGSPLNNLATMLDVYRRYLALLVWPVGLNARYREEFAYSFAAPGVLVGLAVVTALAALAWAARRRRPLLTFAIVWSFLMLLPVSHIVPTSVLYADRYLYYPSLAFGWVLGDGFRAAAARHRRAATIAAMLVLAAWATGTVRRTRDWRDSVTLWEASVATDPRNFFAHAILGDAYVRADRMADGIKAKEEGIRLAGTWRHIHGEYANLGLLYAAAGDLARAESLFDRAIELAPGHGPAFKGLGVVSETRGECHVAVYHYLTAYANGDRGERVREGLRACWSRLGREAEWTRFGREPEAVIAAEAAAHAAEAARLAAAGEARRARARLVMVRRLLPRDVAAALAIAAAELRLGARERAAREYRRVLTLDPGNRVALSALAALDEVP